MTYSDIIKLMSSATHIYADVSPDEQNAIRQDCWAVEVGGLAYIGTTLPIEALASKEIVRSAEEAAAEVARLAVEADEQKAAEEARLEATYTQAIQNLLDSKAREKRYDSIITAALRAGYPGPFHEDGVAYATWMDGCWAKSYTIMAEVQSGARPLPSVAELLALMPALALPA